MNSPEGLHPNDHTKRVCNTIENGEKSLLNFLFSESKDVALSLVKTRDTTGIIDQNRLFNNLLSSQPLCVNFFSLFVKYPNVGLAFLKKYWPDIDEVVRVEFEFGPSKNESYDNSALDVAFIVKSKDRNGLIGLEVKYTDDFSSRPQNSDLNYGDVGTKGYDSYKNIFVSASNHFAASYEDFVKNCKLNQLFRSELIGQWLLQKKRFDFVRTGLFCHPEDENAISSGNLIKGMLKDPQGFSIITYNDFIECVQMQSIPLELRKKTMLLWARYVDLSLSSVISN